MMRANPLRAAIAEGRAITNGWLAIPSAYSAEAMGHQGFDSLTVDLQHGMIGFDAALAMLQAISATPATPLARVARLDYALVMQLLDAGAYGVICPMISTPGQASDLAAFCRYPPRGRRSFGPARGLLYGGADYFARANEEILAIAMLETREAVANCDAILATPGIDGIYVGPNDLCLDFGKAPSSEPADPEVAAIVVDLARRAGRAGKIAGVFCSGGAAARRRIEEGFTLVTPGNDVAMLTKSAREALAALRGAAPASAAGTGY